MRKLLVIVRREYLARVRTKMFVVMTILMPAIVVASGLLPGLLFMMKTGGATRLAVVDMTGRLYGPVRDELLSARDEDEEGGGEKAQLPARGVPDANNPDQMRRIGRLMGQRFEVEQVPAEGRGVDQIRAALDERVRANQLDGYIILPPDVLSTDGRAEYRARNLGDTITSSQIKHSLNRAVVEQRLRDANIDRERVRELSKQVEVESYKIGKGGAEKDSGAGSFGLAFGVGLFVYMGILLYGQMILSAVVEEKTTRISEVLFSSVRPFQLMAGKLVGTSLVGLTQLAIWALVFLGFTTFGVVLLAKGGVPLSLPAVPAAFYLYAFLFYLVGFFMYGTIYLIVGSMVTNEREAGQMALPVILIAVLSIWMSFPVIRSPNSPLAFWVSIAPFLSPVTMLVRVVTEVPPAWQIALSLSVGVATIILLTWVAARIYRVGMLMYGKSANIPEVLRWLRRA